ncbi:MAG: Tad domain-containing protein [Chloroflexota bacterium]
MKRDGDRGQILVQVALMAVAIFAFVALAVDVGQIYGGRRRMQNAADAGALAGAQEICFGGYQNWKDAHDAAEAAAVDYAVRNGADRDRVAVQFPISYTVDVVVDQTFDTFFAGVIGIRTADVSAEAAALCGGTTSAGGLWPLAFKESEYTDKEKFPCGEPFMVFSSSDDQGPDLNCAPDYCYADDGVTELTEEECASDPDCDYEVCSDNKCNCPAIGIHFDTDDRGWLRFPDAEEERPDACKAQDNCGAEALKCYLEYDHPGPIEEETCIPGKSGTTASVKQAIESRIGDSLRIILWDEEECTVPAGWCPGDPYHVADFGCIEVLSWEQSYKLSTWGSNATCRTFHAIEAKKLCDGDEPDPGYEDCYTTSGSGSGLPSDDWELRTVTLVK